MNWHGREGVLEEPKERCRPIRWRTTLSDAGWHGDRRERDSMAKKKVADPLDPQLPDAGGAGPGRWSARPPPEPRLRMTSMHPMRDDPTTSSPPLKIFMRYLLATLMATLLVLGATAARTQAQATASTDPDLRFLDGMIPHHQGAIDEATEIEPKAHRPEVKQLAAE